NLEPGGRLPANHPVGQVDLAAEAVPVGSEFTVRSHPGLALELGVRTVEGVRKVVDVGAGDFRMGEQELMLDVHHSLTVGLSDERLPGGCLRLGDADAALDLTVELLRLRAVGVRNALRHALLLRGGRL